MFNGWIPYKINDDEIKPDEYIDIGDCIGSCRKSDIGEYVPDFNNGSTNLYIYLLLVTEIPSFELVHRAVDHDRQTPYLALL